MQLFRQILFLCWYLHPKKSCVTAVFWWTRERLTTSVAPPAALWTGSAGGGGDVEVRQHRPQRLGQQDPGVPASSAGVPPSVFREGRCTCSAEGVAGQGLRAACHGGAAVEPQKALHEFCESLVRVTLASHVRPLRRHVASDERFLDVSGWAGRVRVVLSVWTMGRGLGV